MIAYTATGIQAIRNIFKRYPDNTRPDKEILQLLEISLTSNAFLFNDHYYLQVEGTAMGKKCAPAYANIYMAEWEREALAKCPYQPTCYYRFLDDIIGAWPHDIQLFTDFINILNGHHPSIKVKYTIHPQERFFSVITINHRKHYTLEFTSNQQTHMLYFINTVTILNIHLRE